MLEAIWEFPKIRGTLFWGPYNKDPIFWGTILGSLGLVVQFPLGLGFRV